MATAERASWRAEIDERCGALLRCAEKPSAWVGVYRTPEDQVVFVSVPKSIPFATHTWVELDSHPDAIPNPDEHGRPLVRLVTGSRQRFQGAKTPEARGASCSEWSVADSYRGPLEASFCVRAADDPHDVFLIGFLQVDWQ